VDLVLKFPSVDGIVPLPHSWNTDTRTHAQAHTHTHTTGQSEKL